MGLMHPIRDRAIVLRTIRFQDRHRVVTALTENHGQISALAKNSIQSRRFGGTLEPFAAAEWLFNQKPGADLYTLSEAEIRQSFDGICKDFEKFSLASFFSELMIKMAPQGEPCPDLFRLHSNALALLNEPSPIQSVIILLNAYMAKLLQWSGNQPRLLNCLQCQSPLDLMPPTTELTGVIADAGWVCSDCRTEGTRHIKSQGNQPLQKSLLRVSALALKDFHIFLRTPIRRVLELTQAPHTEHQRLFQFLEALYIFHIPGFDQKPIESLRFCTTTIRI